MRSITAALVVTFTLHSAPAFPACDDPPGDELDGRWKVVRVDEAGKAKDNSKIFYKYIIFSKFKHKFEYYSVGGSSNRGPFSYGEYQLRPEEDPKWIDLIPAVKSNQGSIRRGVYERKGTRLRIALAPPDRPRPTGFGPGPRLEIWEYTRLTSDGPGQQPGRGDSRPDGR